MKRRCFKRIPQGLPWLLALTCLIWVGGCGHSYFQSFSIQPQVMAKVKTIAVLPLENLTSTTGAGDIVTDMVVTELHRLEQFRVFGKVELEQIFQEKNIQLPKLVDRAIATEIARRIEADAIIIGTVTEYFYQSDDLPDEEEEPVVGIHLKLVDAQTGTVIWGSSGARSSYEAITYEKDALARIATKAIREMLKSLRG